MLLVETLLKIIFLNSQFVNPYNKDIDEAFEDYEAILESCTSRGEIRHVIDMECELYLPITLAVDTFERYLSFSRNDPQVLRIYADYINTMIPDWHDYASKLKREADSLTSD